MQQAVQGLQGIGGLDLCTVSRVHPKERSTKAAASSS